MTAARVADVSNGAGAMLTVDEARSAVARSAVDCLASGRCGRDGLIAILHWETSHPSWRRRDVKVASSHRRVLRQVGECGHGWIVEDELAGVIAAAGLDGEGAWETVENLDVLTSQ